MPLSILFKNDKSIPFEYRYIKEDSSFQRLYHSYLNDQEPRYNIFRTENFVKIILNEEGLSPNDVTLSFEIIESSYEKFLIVEIHNRLISQKIKVAHDLDIYKANASCDGGVLEISIPKK